MFRKHEILNAKVSTYAMTCIVFVMSETFNAKVSTYASISIVFLMSESSVIEETRKSLNVLLTVTRTVVHDKC